MMKSITPVIIESPFAGDVAFNVAYAKKCMADSLHSNEAPYASHLLYTQDGVLDDSKPEERKLGIEAGFVWKQLNGVKTVFYIDLGWSKGMLQAHRLCVENMLPYEIRELFNKAINND